MRNRSSNGGRSQIAKADEKLRAAKEPKQVIKQGLSEYFLFTIEGRETSRTKNPSGWLP